MEFVFVMFACVLARYFGLLANSENKQVCESSECEFECSCSQNVSYIAVRLIFGLWLSSHLTLKSPIFFWCFSCFILFCALCETHAHTKTHTLEQGCQTHFWGHVIITVSPGGP